MTTKTTTAAKKTGEKTIKEKKKPVGEMKVTPADEQDHETPFTEAEVIPHEETGVVVMNAEVMAAKEVSRYNDPRPWIAKKKKEYSSLKIKGLEDKDGQKAVKAAWQEIRNKRLGVANVHKEIKAGYLVIARAVDKEKNELTELLEEVEEQLKTKLDQFEEWKQEEKNRKEREEKEQLENRVTLLISSGMAFDGRFYSIGESISMDTVTLKEMDEERFDQLVQAVVSKKTEIDQAEAKRIQDEETEKQRLQDQKDEQEREDKRLKDEREALAKEKRDARLERLTDIGYIQSHINGSFVFTSGKFQHSFAKVDLAEMTATEWSEMLADAKVKSDLIKKEDQRDQEQAEKDKADQEKRDAEKRELDARVTLRTQQLNDRFEVVNLKRVSVYDMVPTLVVLKEDVEKMSEESWLEHLIELKEIFDKIKDHEKQETDRIKEEDETARKAALSDAQAIKEWALMLAACMEQMPVPKDPELAVTVKTFDQQVADHLSALLETVNGLASETE